MNSTAAAARVGIQMATGRAADRAAADLPEHVFPSDRVARLTEAVGDVASDVRVNACADLDACLVRLAGETLAWLESREAERRG